MSEYTNSYKKKYKLCKIFSILFTVLPIIVYTIIGFINGDIGSKITLGMCLFTTIVFVLINIVLKHRIRSTIWVILIGIYVAVDNIIPLLLLLTFTTICDEFILEPLSKKYKNKFIINNEIDKRK